MRFGLRGAVRALALGVALLAGATGSTALAQPALATDRAKALEAVDAAFAAEATAHPVGSLTVGVVEHGRLIWTKTYGYADMDKKTPANRRTVYRIGSITKQFTAVALLQLARDGKVRLDDPAVKYLPELRTVQGFDDAAAGQVTLLSLATHRAGLGREPGDPSTLRGPIDAWEASVRAALARTSYAFKPNDEALYSNIGYAALGLALENAAGTPYTELVERKVLAPLGMTSSGFRPTPDMLARLARGYGMRNGKPDPTQADTELVSGRGYKIPNGGLFTTVDDLAKFLAFEMGDGPAGVLPRDLVAANVQRSFPMKGGGRYGVGFMIEPHGENQLIGHGGAVAGFTSAAYFDPRAEVGIVCLRSSDFGCEGDYFIEALAALAPAWRGEAQRLAAAATARARRVADQQPFPGGEAVLRRVMGELRAGKPDYGQMSDGLADTTRQQLPGLQAMLARMGDLQSLTFKGVGPNGADIYEAVFGGGKLAWRLVLAPDGRLQALGVGAPR
ncbi:serine hydrolase domain-containing protein [Phenylobacterium sp.]|jgi:CubicO group peptidase (beta-lactamase class C family)|uniref:serine hydrolase domain-containing protein n=1 Tax=Phenylobacterium sp. TaxID=1871053 RepID=UPI002F4176ED